MASPGAPLRVLLVEDSPDDALLLGRELRRAGYEPDIRRVADVPALSGALADAVWDLVISDVNVPGVEVLDTLRLVRRSGRDVPVIVVSGRVGEDEAVAILKAGAHDFVTKERLARLAPAIERERREAGERAARRAAERALRESEERLRLALDAGELGSWDWDLQDDRLAETGAMRALLGRALDEDATGLASVLRHVHPEDRARLEGAVGRAVAGGAALRAEFRVVGPTGDVRWLEAQARVVHDGGGRPRRLIGIARDVSERRAAEAEREARLRGEKLRALGQMASGIAHDLNQALAIVMGHADLATEALGAGDSATAGGHLETIVRASAQGAETVQRLLAFARRREEGPSGPVDVGELLAEVARFTAPTWAGPAQAEGRPIRLDVAAESGLWVRGWGHALREALVNLVLNAVDALPSGGSIRLAARRGADGVVIEVADSGVGMAPEVLARLPEPFFTTKGERGTGLGLAMVFGTVERHGGRVDVESAVGAGTTFRLALPADDRPTTGVPAPRRPDAAGRLRILAVDDEPGLLALLHAMLSRDGHEVRTTGSAEAAVGLLERGAYDLVVSDLSLGAGMNGWDLAALVRRRWPGTRFALASGWGAAIADEEARARDVDAVLAKPYRLAELRELVARAAVAGGGHRPAGAPSGAAPSPGPTG